MTSLKKRFLIPGVLGGIVILVLSVMFKSSPSVQPNFDKARLVSVQPLTLQQSVPSVVAFGRVEPKNSWQAIAEVSGKVIYRHPELEAGRLLSAGTLVLEVDPLEYELKQAQALANVNSTKAQLKRLLQEQKNINASLDIEKEKLALVEQEYQRKLALQKKNLISFSDVESQKQALLIQKKLVQDLSSALNLMPDDKKVVEAQLNVNQALLADAQRQLENTRLTLPFDARVADVNVEASQAVSVGEVLFEVHRLGVVEVKAELSLQDAETLMASVNAQVEEGRLPNVERLGFAASVALQMGKKLHQWPAKLTRIASSIDPDQATIGFYLEVEQDFKQLDIGKKPPLTKGMFVTALIQGFASEQFLIPEKALHGEQVYIMNANKQLSLRDVQVVFRNKAGVAIAGDIKEGELLILNDLIPAIPGMSLKTEATSTEESQL
ncbi:HlyD family efflux transporter periplasmic adaptor subunit [Psychromonas sp.]|nr:HlyD family efflux transporter periplasmic adaptor subunit [Psychromonas sp.]